MDSVKTNPIVSLKDKEDAFFDCSLEFEGQPELVNESFKKAVTKANEAAKAAELANAAKNQFLANIGGELNISAKSISALSEKLLGGQLDNEQRKFTNLIYNQSILLSRLVNDIMDFSAIESGKLKIDITECSIDGVLSQIKSIFEPMWMAKNLKFEFIKDSSTPSLIKTDIIRLNQCLTNLINNAIKFTRTGSVRVRTAAEKIDGKAYLRFDIEDTGVGISDEQQGDIFSYSTQTDGEHAGKHGGTGLGLAITKRLAELLGGNLCFASTSGKGTVFTLKIFAGYGAL